MVLGQGAESCATNNLVFGGRVFTRKRKGESMRREWSDRGRQTACGSLVSCSCRHISTRQTWSINFQTFGELNFSTSGGVQAGNQSPAVILAGGCVSTAAFNHMLLGESASPAGLTGNLLECLLEKLLSQCSMWEQLSGQWLGV